jgi:DnaA family protein
MKQLALGVRLRDDAVFASFAPGVNAEVVAALRADQSVPLWLWGGRKSGKTHLLQALCAATDRPQTAAPAAGPPAAYFPLDRRLALPPEALLGFERCQVLCLDDVDAVVGDAAWERALFRVFNEAAEQQTRLVFAAGAAPRQLAWVLEDWRSRAAACVVYQLRDLDDAGLIEALRLRAAQRGLDLPLETSEYLLRRMPRDLASLLAIFDRLDEASLMAQRRLTVPFIRDALETLAETKP